MKVIDPNKYIFTILGLLVLAGTYFISEYSESLLSTSVITNGTVIDIKRTRSMARTTYQPIVEFTAEDGTTSEFTYPIGSELHTFTRGQVVEVLYPKSSPELATIKSPFPMEWVVIVLGCLGTILLSAGLALIAVGLFRPQKMVDNKE